MRFLLCILPLLMAAHAAAAAAPVAPSTEPTAFLPPVGTAWLSFRQAQVDGVARITAGLRPTRAVTMAIRQGDDAAVADLSLEMLAARDGWPALVLDSRGLGGAREEAWDSLLLGRTLGDLEVTGGAGLSGGGTLHPFLGLRLPMEEAEGWLTVDSGHGEGPGVEGGWRPLPFLTMTTGWRRDQGLTAGFTFSLAASGLTTPWPGRERRPDAHDPADIGLWQSPARQLAHALPPGAAAPLTIASHRLGLPGVAATIMTDDLTRLGRGQRSAAEVRRQTRFQRAAPPDSLGRPWQVLLDARLDLEPVAYAEPLPRRASAGARLDLLPWPGLVLTAAGRAGTAARIEWPETPLPAPGRQDAGAYLDRTYSLERLQIAFVHALGPDLDMLVEAGHLESQFGGGGAELRYQPVLARWSAGVSLHQVWKRAPDWDALYRGTGRLTGHVAGGWESGDAETRSELRAGRYLAGDWGGGIGLMRQFGHGAILAADLDITTWTTRFGLSVTIPFGTIGPAIDMAGSIRVVPLSGAGAERLDRALTLGDLRYSAGYGRLLADWDRNFRP